jgi:hypothetical protein
MNWFHDLFQLGKGGSDQWRHPVELRVEFRAVLGVRMTARLEQEAADEGASAGGA